MNETEDMHKRDALRAKTSCPLMKGFKITGDDVGKIFVVTPEKTGGKIVTRQKFLEMDIEDIGEWDEITEFDINC